MHQYYIPVISYNEISANVNFSLSFNHKIEKKVLQNLSPFVIILKYLSYGFLNSSAGRARDC